jgi:hypothetical protein
MKRYKNLATSMLWKKMILDKGTSWPPPCCGKEMVGTGFKLYHPSVH